MMDKTQYVMFLWGIVWAWQKKQNKIQKTKQKQNKKKKNTTKQTNTITKHK